MDILLNNTDCNYLKINASNENSIDDIREKVIRFATAFDPKNLKIVYFNECDRISLAGQNSLNQLIEDTWSITRYFFLCNDESKITEPIKSRCSYHLDLNDPPGTEIFRKCSYILKQEGIKIKDKSAIVDLIKKCYPDIRKTIGTLQSNVVNGEIENISFSTATDIYKDIFDKMKKSDVESIRKLLKSNYMDYSGLYEYLYCVVMDNPDEVKKPGEFIIDTGEYLYRNSSVAISEINFMSYIFNLMRKEVI